MKVICIDEIDDLTIGKVYDSDTSQFSQLYPNHHLIIDDTGGNYWYHNSHFIPLDEYRSRQIDKIL